MRTAQQVADKLMADTRQSEGEILLDLEGYKISVQSNSEELLEKLGIYFAHTLGAGDADCKILAIECEAQDLGLEFTDWKREAGKTGRKDAFHDLKDGRLIQKVRTGMVFLQSRTHVIAAGPCVRNDNQVINFINAQYMNYLQQNGAVICHAAGLVANGKALGLAGLSGGGKSTLMLHALASKGVSYLTNDRLFILDQDGVGIPKLPRVNPGTMLNDENLIGLLPQERRAELEVLPENELWDLEEKYDVFVEDVYGEGKVAQKAPLRNFLILNWERNSQEACKINRVDISERQELLAAIMKSPGPFYQCADGAFIDHQTKQDPATYNAALKDVEIYEASGGVDFSFATSYCLENLLK